MLLNNRYRLISELGKGGMGTIYSAHDTLLDRDVAVKLLSGQGLGTEGRARMLREAQAAAKLNHPNIVSIYDAGEAAGDSYIVMELIEGESLHQHPPADLEELLSISRQICAALEHAHLHQTVHRDLKPENVLVTPEGIAKLTDFGLARPVASRLTSEGTIIGTVFYISPEQALGLDEGVDEFGTPIRIDNSESWEDNTNDLDAYVILGTYKLDKDNTIGANYTYVNHSDINLGLSNAGLHANGLLLGALTYAAEADFQFGEVFESPNEEDFGGWAVMAKLGYKLEPVNLRASFAYGSGDDDATDDDNDEFFTLVGNDLQSPLARFVHYTQIYERSIRTAAFNNPFSIRTTGIANTTYFNLGLDFMPMKDLSLSLDGFYLLATETDGWEDYLDLVVDPAGTPHSHLAGCAIGTARRA